MLLGLATIWRDAITASSLHFFVTPLTLGLGLASSFLVCVATIWFVLRRQARRPARALLMEGDVEAAGADHRSAGRLARWIATAGLVGGAGMVGWRWPPARMPLLAFSSAQAPCFCWVDLP
jgi:hypothetical protein